MTVREYNEELATLDAQRDILDMKMEREERERVQAERLEKILGKKFGKYLSRSLILEIASTVLREYHRKIKVKVFDDRIGYVGFYCNLAPNEVKSRQNEVVSFLPYRGCSEEFSIILEDSVYHEKHYLPKKVRKEMWRYYAAV